MKRPILWENLVDRIEREIQTLNLFARSDAGVSALASEFIKKPNGEGFCVKRRSFPTVNVDASFTDKRLVRIDYSYQRGDFADIFRWAEIFDFSVDENDNIHLRHKAEFISVDDATLYILAPIKDPKNFRPPRNAKPD